MLLLFQVKLKGYLQNHNEIQFKCTKHYYLRKCKNSIFCPNVTKEKQPD